MNRELSLLTLAISREQDILLARQRTRLICQFVGFSNSETTRITTALSEVARNAFEYGRGGTVAFSIETHPHGTQDLVIRVADTGPGIANVEAVLSPDFISRTGMGIGIRGSRSLMDRFTITSANPHGTIVLMAKQLPWSAAPFAGADAARLAKELAKVSVATPLGELQVQNQSLLRALQELKERQAEVERLGIVAETARARAEEAQHVAERSQVVRERFMALTTHELRTPLNAIIGYLDLLDMQISDSLTEKQKDFFARTQRASKHLMGVINDFLDMGQGDAGRLRVSRDRGAARHVMSEATTLLAPQAAARNVTLQLSETSDHLMYYGDPDRIRQVLVNVIGNAVSFTPPGGVVDVVATRATVAPLGSALTDGPWCTIRVEDNGPGIPPDKLDHVFEPFVQLSSDGQSTRKGSGLGLTVSRQLALLMGGDLTVESTGAGAVFTLWLLSGEAGRTSGPVEEQAEAVIAS